MCRFSSLLWQATLQSISALSKKCCVSLTSPRSGSNDHQERQRHSHLLIPAQNSRGQYVGREWGMVVVSPLEVAGLGDSMVMRGSNGESEECQKECSFNKEG
jgi:hypothetical protein